MQAYINALTGLRMLVRVCFVGALFALGSAHAGGGNSVPAKLTELKSTPVEDTPVTTTKVDPQQDPPRITRRCIVVSRNSSMPADTGQYLSGVYLQSCCPGCAPVNVQALFIPPVGGISSQAQEEVCQYQ